MSGQLSTTAAADSADAPATAPGWRRIAVIVALFALAGAVGGLVVGWLYTPATGMFYDGVWQRGLLSIDPPAFDTTASDQVFDGTAWFVVVSVIIGLVLGGGAALLLPGAELVTLAAVALGSVVSGVVTYAVVRWRAGPDPASATGVADGTTMDDTLHLVSPWLVLIVPAAALAALALVYLLVSPRRGERHPRNTPADPVAPD